MRKPEEDSKNIHYSDQTGHALRGAYDRVARQLGSPPRIIPGFDGVEETRRKRTMRRISDSGR